METTVNVSTPTLTAYLPAPSTATGTAVIIAPGGGFIGLSINSEGHGSGPTYHRRHWLLSGKGKPVQIVHKGDVIKCLPGVAHWHGAVPNSGFAYIAVTPTQKGKTIWLEPVSDKDYNGVK